MADLLADLSNKGVSIWLDDLSRQRLTTGSLAGLVARDHVVGVTTNLTIFAKAITGSDAYTEQIRDLRARGVDTGEALRALTTFDVRWASDVLRPVYDATEGVDGRVSIEVDPRLAHNTETTIAEARALWWLVDRPNLFKIPAAPTGPSGHRGVPGRGDQHQHHADLLPGPLRPGDRGLPRRPGTGPADRPGPVIDRFGRLVLRVPGRHRGGRAAGQDRDARGAGAARQGGDRQRQAGLPALREDSRRAALGGTGGGGSPAAAAAVGLDLGQGPGLPRHPLRDRPGRTGVVNTMPEATLRAVAGHGRIPEDSVRGHYDDARQVLSQLQAVGVDYGDLTATLESNGLAAFDAARQELGDQLAAQLRHRAGRPAQEENRP